MSRVSILDFYLDNAQVRGEQTAALVRRAGSYQSVTWSQMVQQSRAVAQALLNLGVSPQDRICLMSQTRLEWVTIDMGIVAAGAVCVPIYQSNLADECQHIVADSGAHIVICEDAAQTAKFLQERGNMPQLMKIIQIDGDPDPCNGFVTGLSVLLTGIVPDLVRQAHLQKNIAAQTPYSLIYTSGTTGRPKGVIITHDNMLYTAEAIRAVNILRESDVELLFLPLAHVFARVLEIAWLAVGHVVAFAQSMDTLRVDMADARPHLMAGVPRVFEKFYAAVVQHGRLASGPLRFLFNRALVLSERNAMLQVTSASDSGERGAIKPLSWVEKLEYAALKRTVLAKVNRAMAHTLGGRMRVMVSGGAPLSPKIAHFFCDVGVEILEGFGLTETSAASCVNRPGHNCIGTVGEPLPGTTVRIAPDGELLVQSRGVSPGYWNQEHATHAAMIDGWFYTGDIARVEPNGCVRIVDRKKDIIVTAGGKNVAPQNIENRLKSYPLISQVVVHGDKRNFLCAIITLNADALQSFAQEHDLGAASYAALSARPEVFCEVEKIVTDVNRQLARYETIKKFKILEHDFTQDNGEVTPSLKIKRRVINQRYRAIFDAFYSDCF